MPGGGGSSEAQAFEPVSILTGIANLAGPNVHVLYTRGLPEINEVFRHTHWEAGVKVAIYPSKDFSGTPETATPSAIADWKTEMWGPEDKAPRSIRYTAAYQGSQNRQVSDPGRGLRRRRLHSAYRRQAVADPAPRRGPGSAIGNARTYRRTDDQLGRRLSAALRRCSLRPGNRQ